MQRRRFKQTQSLEERLSEEAKRLREEAKLLPPGALRDKSPITSSPSGLNRVALVIGNAKYPDADALLKTPVNDARDIADELKRDGFSVDIGENLTGEAMRRAFDKFFGKLKLGSAALIFFAGFGIQSNRQSYIIPVDASL